MRYSACGRIEVVCGSMFSGKTEELIRRLRRAQIARQKVQIFKPSIDKRYFEDYLVSHSGLKLHVTPIEKPEDILERLDDSTRVVGVDEAQFFSDNIVEIVQKLANRGLRVILAGLDMDYRGVPFGPMPTLLSLAESVTKVSAICMSCGGAASRSQRLINDEEQIVVGAEESYEARCRMCHEHSPAEKMQQDFMVQGSSVLDGKSFNLNERPNSKNPSNENQSNQNV